MLQFEALGKEKKTHTQWDGKEGVIKTKRKKKEGNTAKGVANSSETFPLTLIIILIIVAVVAVVRYVKDKR